MQINYKKRDDMTMYKGPTGKLKFRAIITEFDQTLMKKFGVNMTDASITRDVALNAFHETGCPTKAAELCALRRGLKAEPAGT